MIDVIRARCEHPDCPRFAAGVVRFLGAAHLYRPVCARCHAVHYPGLALYIFGRA